MRHIKFLSSILLILSMVSFIAEGQVMTEERQKTQTKREITADSLKWEYEKGIAIFSYNVAMNGEEGEITSSKMTVFFDENDEITKMIAEGTANLIREKQKGGGEIIEIYPSEDLIILKQGAWISSEKALFKGEEINFDTAKDIINIIKGVKGEIQTGSNEEKQIKGGTKVQNSKDEIKEEENN
jgi:lipopolysaccharide transport protein LptA